MILALTTATAFAAGFDVDPADVALALGLDELAEEASPGWTPVTAAEEPSTWLDLVAPPPGYALAPVLPGSPAATAAGSLLGDLEAAPVGWVWTRPGEAIAVAARERDLCADEDAAHAAAWSDHQLGDDPPGVPIPCSDAAVRSAAWECWHAGDAERVHDLMLLVGVWEADASDDAGKAARLVWIRRWSLRERGLVAAWAVAGHVHASDHDDVVVPERPSCLDHDRPA